MVKAQGYLCRHVSMRGKCSPLLLSQHSRCNALRLHHRCEELQRGIYSQLQQWFNSEPHHVGVITHCEWVASHPEKVISKAAWELSAHSCGPTPAAACVQGEGAALGWSGGAVAAAAAHTHAQKTQELEWRPLPVRLAVRPGLSKHLQTLGHT